MKRTLAAVTVLIISAVSLAGCSILYPAYTSPDVLLAPTASPAGDNSTPAPVSADCNTPAAYAPAGTATATLGFAGDILMMTSQITNAKQPDGSYDFSMSFAPFEGVIRSVDFMCANFECTLAGEDAGYTEPRPTAAPEQTTAPNQSFNAPDELAKNLFDAGFDAVTTANNHCADRGEEGLFRTVRTLRAAGLMQTGTFLSPEDRVPLTVDINGIRVGIVAAASGINDSRLGAPSQAYMVARLDTDALASDIAACREAGAEYIIVCPHWGTEYENESDSSQQRRAKVLIELGADAIIGSHPHHVQEITWVSARRDGVTVAAPIVYSLGNFISNMSPSPRDYGMFVKLTLTRASADAPVMLTDLTYLPTLCLKQRVGGRTLHQVLPCFVDTPLITAAAPLTAEELREVADARAHVIAVAGSDFSPMQ